MRASSAHIAYSQPFHVQAELTRNLLDRSPATIIRQEIATAPVSADDQLYTAREDPRDALRGVPIIGRTHVPGAMKYTRPDTCLDKLAKLQLLWMAAGTSA